MEKGWRVIPALPKYSYDELFERLLNCESKYSVELSEQPLTCPTIPKFNWYMSKATDGKYSGEGSGESFNDKIAKIRAVGEALERLSIFHDTLEWKTITGTPTTRKAVTSSGFAFHIDFESALLSSYREMVERSIILKAWLSKKGAFELKGLNAYLFLSKVNALKNGLSNKFIYFPNEYGIHTVACTLQSKSEPPYLVIGYGSSDNISNALEKSFMECWRMYWGSKVFLMPQAMQKEKVTNCIEHYHYYAVNKINFEEVFHLDGVLRVSETAKLGKIIDPSDLIEKCDKIIYADLSTIDLCGYVTKIYDKHFCEMWVGGLLRNEGARLAGEIHPIA